MKGSRNISDTLRRQGEKLEIPEGLKPEKMYGILKEHEKKHEKKRHFREKHLYPILTAAAAFCLIMGMLLQIHQTSFLPGEDRTVNRIGKQETVRDQSFPVVSEEEQEELELPKMTYEEIYACLSANWQQDSLTRGAVKEEGIIFEASVEDLAVMADSADSMQKQQALKDAFGRTNVQTAQVDEADQIKNDGRYLYQIVRRRQEGEDGRDLEQLGIQILDTEDGLKETAFLDGFENLEEFYLWEDFLITVENKYYDVVFPVESSVRKTVVEDLAACGKACLVRGYHEISIYQIADKSHPRKQKTFTLQGTYESSRISEGYFYGISRFAADPGEGERDYDAYIPSLDGKRMEAEQIYCPPDADGTDYLVLVSIDLSDPSSFADSRAILAGAGTYYVSPQNIYVAWYQSVYEMEHLEEGSIQDRTKLLRFSFRKGRFYAQAGGEIPGRVESSFSMDEYKTNLRIAVTVQEYQAKEIIDDRTGERLGLDYGESTETNALYILGPSLTIKGKIEGLAEGEIIRSARFLSDMGYFVTFRQTDPLFAVDLSDPEHPEVLGELKVSGFSEYLHFYGEDRLLGIGMEAEEETGREQGMKLSMFDISDPAELKEVSRLHLEDYNYSEALWEHRAVLIDTEENIIGFEAEGSDQGGYWEDYLLFSYQDGAFVQTLKVSARLEDYGYCRARGTFIGDTFYLLFHNGTVRAYDRNTGALLEEIFS